MPLNAWFRDHPYVLVLVGLMIVGLGVIRAQPVAIGAGVILVLAALVRIVV